MIGDGRKREHAQSGEERMDEVARSARIQRMSMPIYAIDARLECAVSMMNILAEVLWACGYSREGEEAYVMSQEYAKWAKQNAREMISPRVDMGKAASAKEQNSAVEHMTPRVRWKR